MDPEKLDATARAAILRDVPALAGLTDATLAALADATVARRYPFKTVFSRLGEPPLGRPLRVMLLGSCLAQTPGKFDRRRVVAPGMLFGEEGLVAWASTLGLIAPVVGQGLEHYTYAAEDCWVLELPAERFAALFAGGAHPSALAAARGAALRASRADDLLDALRRTPELVRASIDDVHGLIEGGTLRTSLGEVRPPSPDPTVLVVLEGSVTVTLGDTSEERGVGAVIGQTSYLLGADAESASRRLGDPEHPAMVLEIPASHYERQLRANPEFAAAVMRALPELGRPRYHTEVALVLASGPLQRALPLGPMVATLAQAIRSNLLDTTWVVELVWAGPGAEPGPLRIVVPRGTPQQVQDAVYAGLDAILERGAGEVDVLLVDPSALDPEAEIQRALAWALADLRAPVRLSYLFARRGDWPRVLDIVGDRLFRLQLLPTVVLEIEAPAPGLGAAYDDLGEGVVGLKGQAIRRGLTAISAFTRGQLRRLSGEGPRALLEAAGLDPAGGRGPREVWPIRAVRLRLSQAGRDALGGARPQLELEDDRESFRRWARAITGRRVGVALGGAGALSYICVPFIRELRASGVPIDIVSGTSFGSIVGAYYATLGEPGLDLIVRHWYWAQITVAWGWLSTRPLQQWVNYDLGFVDISRLALPFIPVATNAYNGREWNLRAGLVGHTCAASGSLPPLAPTYDGGTRLLDGALSADTPDRVLVEAGAAMVVGVNSVPPPWPEPGLPKLPIPILGDLLRELNPVIRLTDAVRGYGMLFRQAAQSQERFADVTYAADTLFGNGATFFLRNAIVYQAEHSEALQQAVARARTLWSELLSRPRRRRPPGGARPTSTTSASSAPAATPAPAAATGPAPVTSATPAPATAITASATPPSPAPARAEAPAKEPNATPTAVAAVPTSVPPTSAVSASASDPVPPATAKEPAPAPAPATSAAPSAKRTGSATNRSDDPRA